MRVQCNRSMVKSKRLRRAELWFALLGCVCLTSLAHKALAQASPIPSTSTGQLGISPEEPVAPPQPIIVKVPAPSSTGSSQQPNSTGDLDAGSKGTQTVRLSGSSDAGGQAAQSPAPAQPAIPDPDPNNPVAVQSANLLKMAYDLKSEVDKTTKDTLSVTVVRRAAEIEQLARKMRSK